MGTLFVQSHPKHVFDENDTTDYSVRDRYFIQCLKSIEAVIDIDAYIMDHRSQCIIYMTKGSSFYTGEKLENVKKSGYHYFQKIMSQQDIEAVAEMNAKAFDFFYSLPVHRRTQCYYTQDFVIYNKAKRPQLINHKLSALDLTEDGVIRLELCVISYPTHDKPGNAYIKMTDTSTVYEYMKSSGKFVEVKTQKLTQKAASVLKLASIGKTEIEMAGILGVSVNTIKWHKKQIFARIGVKNITEAVQWMNNQKKIIKPTTRIK